MNISEQPEERVETCAYCNAGVIIDDPDTYVETRTEWFHADCYAEREDDDE